MEKLLLFLLLSLPVIFLSWRSLFNMNSHGYYRFFAWEGILWLAVNNWRYWFSNPAGIKQIISWILLSIAGYLVIAGIIVFKRKGNINPSREDKYLFGFEKTTQLIDTGIYKYIRHPMYASLFFLTWGILLKNTSMVSLVVALISSVFLYLTARFDEKECLAYFGEEYRKYMSRTRMFVPYLF